jgi:glycosyltransferase involved in cell wall biosynthesis
MRHSVVVALYNSEKVIGRLLESLMRQTRPPFEIIVVDDCSTDGSIEALRPWRDALTLVALPRNGGLPHSRNAGLSHVRGDWVTFVDADDEYTPTFLEHAANIVEQHNPDLTILGYTLVPSGFHEPVLELVEEHLTPLGSTLFRVDDPLEVITQPDFPLGPGSNVFCRTSLLDEVRFDEQNGFFEGLDLWYRVIRHALRRGPFRCLLETGDYLRVHETPNSMSRRRMTGSVPFPQLLQRLAASDDEYDRRLWNLVASRWIPYLFANLAGLEIA